VSNFRNLIGEILFLAPKRKLSNVPALFMIYFLEKHAPSQTKQLILRPNTEWYTEELYMAKQDRRKSERRMRKTQLTVDKEIYHEKCRNVGKPL
jgi:hypothetical protein